MRARPLIYNLFPKLAGPLERWAPHLERAAAMRFDWLYLNPIFASGGSGSAYAIADYRRLAPEVRGDARESDADLVHALVVRAAALGIDVMFDLVINHTANDAPLVREHPEWYARDASGALRSPFAVDPADPRKRTAWGDLAELDYTPRPAREALVAFLTEVARGYARLGVRGFRCDAAYKVPADVWASLIAVVRAERSDALFLAETLGCTPAQVEALAPAGFDYLFSSAKWWDFRAPWFFEQSQRYRRIAPSIAFPESHDTPRLRSELSELTPAQIEAEYRLRYTASAFLGDGLMIPIGFEFGFARALDVVRTRPSDWEAPFFDLREFIGETNARVASLDGSTDGAAVATAVAAPAGSAPADSGSEVSAPIVLARGCAVAALNPAPNPVPVPSEMALALCGNGAPALREVLRSDPESADGARLLAARAIRVFLCERPLVVAPLGALHRNEPLPEPPGLPVAIEAVTPAVDGGRFAAKRIAGEEVVVEADCFREGHGKLGAELRWRACDAADWQSVVLAPLENDRYRAGFVPERVGAHEFEIVAHADDVAAHATRSPRFPLVVDRQRARFGAWYEMFPRSQGSAPGRHATFAQAALRLPAIAAMGFDVLYLAPIHPIGRTQRKGRDGALAAAPGDPGSPWAIGNEHGGHDALEPRLGTFADFERFVAAAQRHDLEVALDLALQCSPDHPYVREHPEWFTFRPDGTVAYAENPPKRYEDIVNFAWEGPAAAALWAEILRVVRFWIARGVRIFRVDNPHTKPFDFWEWLIASVRAETPQTIFLAEAFTRPKVMRRLAKLGFTQSYTYFTWRNTKRELEVYLGELAQGEQAEYFRPNFFVNTPDILAPVLQRGGRAAFIMRLVLAATLGSSYGIYSGYELCENEALEGREEYAHSEKYEIKVRDWHAPGNIIGEISALNRIRREHLALHDWRTVRFLPSDDEAVLAFEKRAGDDALLVAVNLDPLAPHEATIELGGEAFVLEGLFGAEGLAESDGRLHLRLDPQAAPAHIYRIAAANRP